MDREKPMTDLDKVVETIKRNVPILITQPNTIYHSDGSKTDQCGVTLNKPLEPWPLNAFHKTLATHIHNATRPAKHSHLAANYGIMDNEQDARRWDFEVNNG